MAPLLALREQDGLTFAELSRRTGIKAETLHRWDRKLSQEQRDGEPRFARVDVVDVEDVRPVRSALMIHIGLATVEVSGVADRGTLQTVIEILASRC